MTDRSTEPPRLAMQTLAVVRELYDGRWTVCALAQPEMASHGTLDVNFGELSLFLEEHLQRATPALLSRYSFAEGTTLHHIDVEIPRADLPRRLAVPVPLSVSVVVVPIGRDRWIMVLPLDYTFHIDAKEDLVEAVRAEVRRVVRARELTPWQWLQLLPPAETALEPLALDIELEARLAAAGRAASLRKRLAKQKARRGAYEVLCSVARPVHERDTVFAAPQLTARDDELAELSRLLGGRERRAVALVGDRLVGKTALLQQWLRDERTARNAALASAHAIADREQREKVLAQIPSQRIVFATSAAQLVAGMSGLGQWQERLRRVIDAAETLDAVLYFDDLGDLFADREGSHVDIPAAMRRVLDEGRLRLVGELTPDQVGLFEPRHVGFFANLLRVHVEALSRELSTKVIERAIAYQREREGDRPTLDPRAVPALIELVDRYVPYHAYPGKAMRLLEETRAAFERERDPAGREVLLDASHVYRTFSQRSGIPLFLLRDDHALDPDEVRATFERQLIGQRDAVRRVVETVAMIKANLQPGGRPLSVFLFVGPTGVGKTELAKCLARYLFGSAERLLRFDMSEYQDALAAERLIRGTDRAEGVLTRKVRQQPFCVLLLDEIEKAHSAVFDLLLSVFGEGRLTDARGQTAFFHNAIIIMTSNLGAAHRRTTIGVAPDSARRSAAELDAAYYEKKVAEAFRPEMVGRIDRVIAFHPLSEPEVMRVGELAIARLAQRRGLTDMAITLACDEQASALLARRGYSAHYGARALRRELEDHLVAPIARLCSEVGAAARGATIAVGVATGDLRKRNDTLALFEEHGLRFELSRGVTSSAREIRGVADVSALRRQVDRWFELDRVESVKEQIDMCVSQIAQASKRKGQRKGAKDSAAKRREDSRTAREIGELQSRHHRLDTVYQAARKAREDMQQIEELAMTALFEGEETSSFTDEVRRAYRAFRSELLKLLTVEEPGRDQVALLLHDLSEGNRAMPLWLSGLLDELPRRGWSLMAHIADDPRGPAEMVGGKPWPPVERRRFGPPRTADVLQERLADPSGKGLHAAVILVRGPWAGTLLTTEAGLQRYIGAALPGEQPAAKPQHLLISRLGMLSAIPQHDWDGEALVLAKPASFQLLTKRPAVREVDATKSTVELLFKQRKLDIPYAEYWQSLAELALEHLLIFETSDTLDRDQLFTGGLGHEDEDDDDGASGSDF